jgi:hypothetical protein
MHLSTLGLLLGLTAAFDRMDKHQILQNKRLRQDGHRMKTHNVDSDNNSECQSSRTFKITDQLKKVSLQKKRKLNFPEGHSGLSSKTVRNEQEDVNFQRERTERRTSETGYRYFIAENKTENCSSSKQTLPKDKDGDTYVSCISEEIIDSQRNGQEIHCEVKSILRKR